MHPVEMLTGTPPFTGANLTELATRVLRTPPPSARETAARRAGGGGRRDPPGAVQVAAERFGTMEEFADALARR